MEYLEIKSKKYGVFNVILDEETYQRLKQEFKNLRWCVRKPPKRNNLFYFQKRLSDGSLIELHRWIMGFPDGYIDHINNNNLDNRKENLRIVTNSQNLLNAKVRIDNKSGHKGVYFDKKRNKWVAEIKVNYKKISLGRFNLLDDAIKVRKQAEKKYF